MRPSDIIADIHTHSAFSADSEQSAELMAKTAFENGLSVLGISDHYDYNHFPDKPYPDNFECDIEAKEKEILRIKELYSGKLKVLNGIELGLAPRIVHRCEEVVRDYRFDYVIGSQHIVYDYDPYYPDFWRGRSVTDSMASYFEHALRSVEAFSDFDIFGHLDYPLRYSPEIRSGSMSAEEVLEDPKLKALCDELLVFLAKNGKALEINTGGMRSDLKRANPSVNMLTRFFELGGELVTFGSDAHVPEHIGYGFDEFKAMLKSLGKTSYTVFEDRRARQISF